MFQFTREFIINDNAGKLTGGVKFLKDSTAHIVYIDNMVNLRKADVVKMHKTVAADPVNEDVVIDLSSITVKPKAIVRLVIRLGQEGRVISTYNDGYVEHARQIFVEAIAPAATGSATTVALPLADLVANSKNKRAASDVVFATLSQASGVLTISTPDCYTRVLGVRIVTVPTDIETHVGAVLTGYEDYDTVYELKDRKAVLDHIAAAATAGDNGHVGTEGCGTVAQINKNMRLLTAANIDPYGNNIDERPIPGKKYNQYLIETAVERRHIAGSVMGEISNSLTSFVFYVNQDYSAAFETVITELGALDGTGVAEPVLAKAKDIE